MQHAQEGERPVPVGAREWEVAVTSLRIVGTPDGPGPIDAEAWENKFMPLIKELNR